ncbi:MULTISPECIES: FAD/NAD(P)-binding protein [Halomonas]|uniref:Putative NAD(P)/FAD-binding protein YdhS n=1 Tax=Halomonas ventosae TaxID=229007 RepID=A0A4V3BWL8_9GAMM|nr:FAD/NAD(P)-binding protein [Halomonas ventosae]TDN95398.1 putative NAD(P)/FAD-binding protein YdhS [Halomonas ventosae]
MTDPKDNVNRAGSIAVVGGGYSGVMTAVNLLSEGTEADTDVCLIEPRARAGRGLAYSIWDDSLLLNVPAGNMSALADDPAHFVNYCRELDPSLNGGSFVSRRLYGDYLEATLAQAVSVSPLSLRRIHGEVIAVHSGAKGGAFQLELADGATLAADRVVLAPGFLGPQRLPFAQALAGSPRYIENPWDFRAMDAIPPGAPVAIIGTGHTAIDALFRLTSLDDGRPVHLISRHGLLPKAHRTLPQAPLSTGFPSYLENVPATALGLLRALRTEIKRRQRLGQNWRDVLNELRPYTSVLWQRWPLAERRRFLARLRPWWDVHRHRLAPVAAARLHAQLRSGCTQVLAGQITRMTPHAEGVVVSFRERASGALNTLQVAAVVNCTGPEYDIDRSRSVLIEQLRETGLIQADALRLGLEVDDHYRPIGREGEPLPGLFYVGPMLRARYWEAIAVPELRTHTRQVARQLLQAMA